MKRFWGFVIKEFRHIFRDVRTMIILFLIPVILIVLFGYVINNDIENAKIAVFDRSKDEVTQKLTQKILSSDYFILDANISDFQDIEKAFEKGDIKLAIIFEPAFGEKLHSEGEAAMQVVTDASEPNTANILVNYLQAIVNGFLKEVNPAQKVPMKIIPEARMLFNPEMAIP